MKTRSNKVRVAAPRVAAPRLATADSRKVKPPAKRAEPFYLSPEWRGLMAEIIRERGRHCQDPDHQGPRVGGRIFGDHIVELKDGGAPFDKANILLRCGSCHTRKTVAQRAQRLTG